MVLAVLQTVVRSFVFVRAVDQDPHSFSLLDPDPLFSPPLPDLAPGGKTVQIKTEKMQVHKLVIIASFFEFL